MNLLKGKWTVVILARVKEGPQSYAGLGRLMAISDMMLTTRLRDLQERGLRQRDASQNTALTRRAVSLRPLLESIYAWGLEEAARVVGIRLSTHRSVR
ncbi:MAG: winged helix-turn-helix transcriptional regulator [Myxococcota bacterium]